MSPVRDERKLCDIPHDRIWRNQERGLLSPLRAFRLSLNRFPPLKTVGYSRTSLQDYKDSKRGRARFCIRRKTVVRPGLAGCVQEW